MDGTGGGDDLDGLGGVIAGDAHDDRAAGAEQAQDGADVDAVQRVIDAGGGEGVADAIGAIDVVGGVDGDGARQAEAGADADRELEDARSA